MDCKTSGACKELARVLETEVAKTSAVGWKWRSAVVVVLRANQGRGDVCHARSRATNFVTAHIKHNLTLDGSQTIGLACLESV